jgi:hypothetical protein
VGALIGAVGGVVYWVAALIWPSSIAVVLSVFATSLLCAHTGAAAIVARIALTAFTRRYRQPPAAAELDIASQLTEVSFYLGALATWANM